MVRPLGDAGNFSRSDAAMCPTSAPEGAAARLAARAYCCDRTPEALRLRAGSEHPGYDGCCPELRSADGRQPQL